MFQILYIKVVYSGLFFVFSALLIAKTLFEAIITFVFV